MKKVLFSMVVIVALCGVTGCSDKQERKKKANSAVIPELVETNEIPDLVDANLIACIHAHPLYDGTEKSYASIEGLSCSFHDIADLTGIQRVPNLSILLLSDNPVSDISPLASLTKLERLDLGSTLVVDLNPLSRLAKLNALGLSDTPVVDLSPLAKLTNLTLLKLCNGSNSF